MKNKSLLVIGAVILLLLVGGGYYFFFANKSSEGTDEDISSSIQDESIPVLSAEELGLELMASSDKRKVKFIIGNASDIKRIEYELTYDADIPKDQQLEGGEGKVTRALTGDVDLEGESTYESEFLDLGTCSSGTCRYDTGVESVTLILKVTKNDDKVYSSEASLEL